MWLFILVVFSDMVLSLFLQPNGCTDPSKHVYNDISFHKSIDIGICMDEQLT